MRVSSLALSLVLLVAPLTARAQLRVEVSAGVAASSALVTDSIVEPIRARPAVAPAFSVALDGRLDSVYRVGLTLSIASSSLQGHSPTGTTHIVTIMIVEPAIRLGRRLGPIGVGLRAGLQMYRASEAVGIFRDGGTVTPSVGADLHLPGPRIGGARLGLTAEWSVSRFSTTTLSLSGFTGEQTVQRFGIRFSVAGGPGAH